MRVLYVENNPHMIELFRAVLEEARHEMTNTQDCEEGLRLMMDQPFDVVLISQDAACLRDVSMIHNAKSVMQIPPIIVMADAGHELMAVEAMRLGANDYVIKDNDQVYLQILPVVIKQVVRERQLNDAHKAAEEALRQEKAGSRIIASFIEGASHEFRTPLSIINTSSYLLEKISDEPRQHEYIQHIQDQTETILHLVNRLIKLARLDNIRTFTFMPMELNSLLQDIIRSKQTQIASKNIQVLMALPETATYLMGNPEELSDALKELIDNACKYSEPNASLYIELITKDKAVGITIRDTGVGMSSEEISHAFERLYRADKAHSTPGFGLGLSIASRVIDIHQGEIYVESELGKGTSITIDLPMIGIPARRSA